ncbi:MAG: hypothetical protein IT370_33490 [Deltaproteobacteria bacterium]|nr:hypothetical protein [Deltaproteobacteria bacterium]
MKTTLVIVAALALVGCGKKKDGGGGGGGGGAPVKTTVHTVDNPGFSLDLPEGMTPKPPRDDRAAFEGKGAFDSLTITWSKLPEGVTATAAIDEGKQSYSQGEPDLKKTQVEGTLPGGGPWVAVAKGKFRGSKSWLTLGDVLVVCQGGGLAAEACKTLRAK